MKKFFAIAIIAASFAACNNSGEGSSTKDTTTVAPVDTTSKMSTDTTNKMSADTSHKADTTHKMAADTSKKK